MNEQKSIQNAAPRSTEHPKIGMPRTPSSHKPGGRPKGSRNKAKGILPNELASSMLIQMKDMLPPEHFEYMRGVIRDGKAISTRRELDTLILLLSRNLYPALVMESMGIGGDNEDEDFFNENPEPKSESQLKMPVFRKDVTERLKVLQSLLAQKEKSERAEADSATEKPLLKIFGRNGPDGERLRILVGVESGAVVGNTDEAKQLADEARTISNPVLERQELLSSGEED